MRICSTGITRWIFLVVAVAPLAACGAPKRGDDNFAGTVHKSEEELIRIERKRVKALVSGDWEVLERLHANDFEFINPVGEISNKTQYLESMKQGEFRYLMFEPLGPIKASTGIQAGALRYRSRISVRGSFGVLPPTEHLHTDYYEKREGRWQIVYSQATFGN